MYSRWLYTVDMYETEKRKTQLQEIRKRKIERKTLNLNVKLTMFQHHIENLTSNQMSCIQIYFTFALCGMLFLSFVYTPQDTKFPKAA